MIFKELFPKKHNIIAMLHLAGGDVNDRIDRAKDEMQIFTEEGIDGVIFENYHCSTEDLFTCIQNICDQYNGPLKLGVNVLPNNYLKAFGLVEDHPKLSFIQLDFVAGRYEKNQKIPTSSYAHSRVPQAVVLGGVHPKYYTPVPGSVLEDDLAEGMRNADAIVVTGEGTGCPTPIEKIMKFRAHLGDYPLIIGAGTTADNLAQQLPYADGVIVGSAFKRTTESPVERNLVKEYMDVVKSLQ
jgi:predicted TIM-barrel enzyme